MRRLGEVTDINLRVMEILLVLIRVATGLNAVQDIQNKSLV